jgi:hypothetical protein
MNTRVSYRYTDKTNCQKYTWIILEGTITWEQIEPYLYKRTFFIPGQLGLEDLQYRFALPGRDHPWHDIRSDDVRVTDQAPTIAITAEDLAKRFAETVWQPDWMLPNAAMKAAIRGTATMLESNPPEQSGSAQRTTTPRIRKLK